MLAGNVKSGAIQLNFAENFLQWTGTRPFLHVMQTLNLLKSREKNQKFLGVILVKHGSPPPPFVPSPPKKWQTKVQAFVEWSNAQLLKNRSVLSWLDKRGISIESVRNYKIGYTENPKDKHGSFNLARADFGLPAELKDNGNPKTLWLPKGVTLPTVDPTGVVLRLKIRRSDWIVDDTFPKYIAISGSMNGLNIVGDTRHNVMIIVESELDAFALHSKISDFAFVIAIGSNTKNPDLLTDHLAKSKSTLLICHDADQGGFAMLQKWQKDYKHATPYPIPFFKDVGEAVENGFDLREWALAALHKRFRKNELTKGPKTWK